MHNPLSYFFRNFGPGLITASAAIGTSHFVQATRAGSYFGYELLWFILAVNIFKYPFIEFGSRYTSATNENLLVGYYKLSKPIFYLIFLLSLLFTPLSFAANSFICAGIIKAVFNLNQDIKLITAFLLLSCTIILSIGRYKLLDNIMKVFIISLTITTLVAVFLAAKNFTPAPEIFYQDSAFNLQYLPFLIALSGFMPGSIDLSVWHSLWLKAKNQTSNKLSFKKAQTDFNVGYLISIITALLFLSMGALVIHNSNISVPNSVDDFARLLIRSYSGLIGNWASPIIGTTILAAMLSTVLAVVDSYPRLLSESLSIIKNKKENNQTLKQTRLTHSFFMIIYSCLAILILVFFFDNFKILLDFVAGIAFLVAPIYAFVNYKVVTSKEIKPEFRPKLWLKILSLLGFLFLTGFLSIFLFQRLF